MSHNLWSATIFFVAAVTALRRAFGVPCRPRAHTSLTHPTSPDHGYDVIWCACHHRTITLA
ncbi:hypothetical protein J3R82DRAFT_10014 [Butyriboletus roseoflavus]|nr:hypothetical protein J3R82DRAFT_10014 [Butyriboletus roseoflavus]